MCGIAGTINHKDKEAIEKMTRAILHRGPDDDGFFKDEHVTLGMRRLSIIDIAGGKQPITSKDGRYVIFFNGEVYNYRELTEELKREGHTMETKSDTEVVLRMFEVYGVKSLPRLRGMFTYAIYDKEKEVLTLARDIFGIKPLYYLVGGSKSSLSAKGQEGKLATNDDLLPVLAFSSEIKSFLALEDFKPEVNDKAVFNYLSFQYNPLDETFFKNVYKLPPAHYMVVDGKSGVAKIESYWKFEFNQNETLSEGETAKKILETMEDSVAHHMIADVPVGSFLSGGIDSSIIATLMQKIRGDKKIRTFTVGFESLSEGVEAKETAEPLGTLHEEITVSADDYFKALPKVIYHFDEPVADPSALGIYFLAREARKHVTVVLSGEGSDELFGGYNIYLAPLDSQKLLWIPKGILEFFIKLPFEFFGKNYLRRVNMKLEDWYFGQKYFNESIFQRDEIKAIWKGNPEEFKSLKSMYQDISKLSDSTKMQYVDINTWLVGDILAKADKMTMAHSLELRVPFLDMEVSRLAATLPDRFKWRGGVSKYLLREAFKSILPESTRNRRKLGFPTPVKNWFTSERTDLYNTIFENSYIKGHFNLEYIKKIIADHTSKRTDNSRKIYLLLVLAIWYNTFIDGHS